MKTYGILLLIFLLLPYIALCDQPRPSENALRDFGFRAMEIFQFKNNTADLQVHDMNGDGKDDILFINNKISRFEILIRKEKESGEHQLPAVDERFIDKGFVLDNRVQSYSVADISMDGLPDIVCLDNRRGVRVLIQESGVTFKEPEKLHISDANNLRYLEIADLNGDKAPDILLCRPENASILFNKGKGTFKDETLLEFSTYGGSGATVADVNRDGRLDLLFYFPKEELPLRIRPGYADGRFGWEHCLYFPAIRSVKKADLTPDGGIRLAAILKKGLTIRLYDFENQKQGKLFSQSEVAPRRLALKGIGRKDKPAWVAGDFDGDGYDDLCTAAPRLSQVHLFKGTENGISPIPQTIDSLTGIEEMAITARGELAIFSADEKSVALHKAGGLEEFPVPLKIDGEPLTITSDGISSIFVIAKDGDEKFLLKRFSTKGKDASVEAQSTYKIPIEAAPSGMEAIALNGDNHWVVFCFMEYDVPRAFRLYKGKVSEISQEAFKALNTRLTPAMVSGVRSLSSNVAKGVVNGLEGGEKSKDAVARVNSPLLLVCEGKIARVYKWEKDKFTVLHQLNPRSQSAVLSAGHIYFESPSHEQGAANGEVPRGKKSPVFLLYDEANRYLYRFGHNLDKPDRIFLKSGINELVGMAVVNSPSGKGIVLISPTEVQLIQENSPSIKMKNLCEYTSTADSPSLWTVFPVKLGSPGRKMLGMLDAGNRSVELIGYKDGKFVKELAFEVFRDSGFNYERGTVYEPHDVGTGDFNNDKIRDMALLVHDKLVIYLGE
ncbi:MAG: VCBS repeat-containing protein [bacterium]|nr:VCBS repeat-containing protein [bacterium]